MSIRVRATSDGPIDQVVAALAKYEAQHPNVEIEVDRQNSASLRVRIVDPDFSGISRAERHDIVRGVVEELPEDVQSRVSLLLLLTPEETGKSFANAEFESPIPSSL